ncbi:Ig-like domain (group 2) [Clostridium cavendishii DSM 21758]|uniref:Ig-like domain (Group 2) n=1 Tax=Clostridium cavendishii DSM 21758 TaxID=1121302 RepID=A0A1M6EUF8_9CLOT|nr:LamG-like jellyroll fold domain-containing protein [Clostridium cavendishii]SHI89131.1 Ig-like domain (group 2) [Clostridium cavendishii DSM 21758]
MKKKISLVLSIVLIFSTIFMGSGFGKNVIAVENTTTKQSTDIKPIHQYTFDKDNGDTVIDTGSMAGEDGKFNGKANNTKIITENGEKFRRFNGGDDSIGFNDYITPLGKKSIKFKIRTSSTNDSNLISNLNDGAIECGWASWISGSGQINVSVSNGNTSSISKVTSNKSINDGKWHEILFTWDGTTGTNKMMLYIDDLTNADAVTTAKSVENKLPANKFLIGKYGVNKAYSFIGDLASLEVYNDVLDCSIKVESITLDKSSISLLTGKTDNLTAIVKPDNAINKEIEWSSSDKDIAEYKDGKVVAGKKIGQATITAKVKGTDLKATCEVNVTEDRNKAILAITMVNGITKEYDVSADEISAFEKWFDESNGKGQVRYGFNKKINPYKQVKEYIVFDKIASFEIRSYEADK